MELNQERIAEYKEQLETARLRRERDRLRKQFADKKHVKQEKALVAEALETRDTKLARKALAILLKRQEELAQEREDRWKNLPNVLLTTDHISEDGENVTRSANSTFEDAVAAFEKELILNAMIVSAWNRTKAAEYLGTTRRVIKYKMDVLKIDKDLWLEEMYGVPASKSEEQETEQEEEMVA